MKYIGSSIIACASAYLEVNVGGLVSVIFFVFAVLMAILGGGYCK